jgi:hypothetical protein
MFAALRRETTMTLKYIAETVKRRGMDLRDEPIVQLKQPACVNPQGDPS